MHFIILPVTFILIPLRVYIVTISVKSITFPIALVNASIFSPVFAVAMTLAAFEISDEAAVISIGDAAETVVATLAEGSGEGKALVLIVLAFAV